MAEKKNETVKPEEQKNDKPKKIQVQFDVINSVKGGSGKSTLALLLAAYYSTEEKNATYVIDLDLRGTSWLDNNQLYFEGNEIVTINDLMRDFSTNTLSKVFMKLKMKYESVKLDQFDVNVSVMRPGSIEEVDDVEIDIFEQTIYRIIEKAYSLCITDIKENKKEVECLHIILDLPPSYESHAERIVKHLLLDHESELRKKAKAEKGTYEPFSMYNTNLIMVSTINLAHIKANEKYVEHLFSTQNLSSHLNWFKDNEGKEKKKLKICLVANDVNDVFSYGGLTDTIVLQSMQDITEAFRNKMELIMKYYVIPHLQLKAYLKGFRSSAGDSTAILEDEAYDAIEKLEQQLKDFNI